MRSRVGGETDVFGSHCHSTPKERNRVRRSVGPEPLGYDATMNLPVVGVVAANRISYVIGPDGRILYSYADSNPVKHVENTLSFVKRWREEHN
jgi:hypothetical protein